MPCGDYLITLRHEDKEPSILIISAVEQESLKHYQCIVDGSKAPPGVPRLHAKETCSLLRNAFGEALHKSTQQAPMDYTAAPDGFGRIPTEEEREKELMAIETGIPDWIDALPGFAGLGYGARLFDVGRCRLGEIERLTMDDLLPLGFKYGHALQLISEATHRYQGIREPPPPDPLLTELDVARWIETLPGFEGSGFGFLLQKEGFCTPQSVRLLTAELAAPLGIPEAAADRLVVAARERFDEYGNDVVAGGGRLEPQIEVLLLEEEEDKAGEGKVRIKLQGNNQNAGFKCEFLLRPKLLPLAEMPHVLGWESSNPSKRDLEYVADWKVPPWIDTIPNPNPNPDWRCPASIHGDPLAAQPTPPKKGLLQSQNGHNTSRISGVAHMAAQINL